jgi:hypothetical protein
MAWGQPLGLDELMIVNPSPSDAEAYFLGEDGTLYQVQGLPQTEDLQTENLQSSGQFFLGEDGTLYQVQGLLQTADLQGSSQFFLGEDGTLYQGQGIGVGESPQRSLQHQTCRCTRH